MYSPHMRQDVYIVLDGCYNNVEDGLPVGVYSNRHTAEQEADRINGGKPHPRAVVLQLGLDTKPKLYATIVDLLMVSAIQTEHQS